MIVTKERMIDFLDLPDYIPSYSRFPSLTFAESSKTKLTQNDELFIELSALPNYKTPKPIIVCTRHPRLEEIKKRNIRILEVIQDTTKNNIDIYKYQNRSGTTYSLIPINNNSFPEGMIEKTEFPKLVNIPDMDEESTTFSPAKALGSTFRLAQYSVLNYPDDVYCAYEIQLEFEGEKTYIDRLNKREYYDWIHSHSLIALFELDLTVSLCMRALFLRSLTETTMFQRYSQLRIDFQKRIDEIRCKDPLTRLKKEFTTGYLKLEANLRFKLMLKRLFKVPKPIPQHHFVDSSVESSIDISTNIRAVNMMGQELSFSPEYCSHTIQRKRSCAVSSDEKAEDRPFPLDFGNASYSNTDSKAYDFSVLGLASDDFHKQINCLCGGKANRIFKKSINHIKDREKKWLTINGIIKHREENSEPISQIKYMEAVEERYSGLEIKAKHDAIWEEPNYLNGHSVIQNQVKNTAHLEVDSRPSTNSAKDSNSSPYKYSWQVCIWQELYDRTSSL